MEKIYSKKFSDKLLHVIVRKEDFLKKERFDIVPENHFLQCALLNLKKNQTFKPHRHIWKERTQSVIAQESWVVIQGSVLCSFYDLNDKVISESILMPGDASFTLEGGHNYKVLKKHTLVYEFKTGPYEGQALDKTFIE